MSELEHLVEQVNRLERRAEKLRLRLRVLASEDAFRREYTLGWRGKLNPFTLGLIVGVLSVPTAGIAWLWYALTHMHNLKPY
jgi:hypothetical protein